MHGEGDKIRPTYVRTILNIQTELTAARGQEEEEYLFVFDLQKFKFLSSWAEWVGSKNREEPNMHYRRKKFEEGEEKKYKTSFSLLVARDRTKYQHHSALDSIAIIPRRRNSCSAHAACYTFYIILFVIVAIVLFWMNKIHHPCKEQPTNAIEDSFEHQIRGHLSNNPSDGLELSAFIMSLGKLH